MRIGAAPAAACLAFLTATASAHVPETCGAIQEKAEHWVHKKFGVAAALEKSIQRQDAQQTYGLAGRYLKIDGVLFRKFTAWVNCLDE